MSQTAVAPTTALSGRYQLDPSHSRLGFVARHAMIAKVRGEFEDFEGTLEIDAEEPTRSTAEVHIKAASITTHDAKRDEHLRSGDFLDTENQPELVFRSTAVDQIDGETFRVTGDLTIRGVTNPVTVDITFGGAATDPFGYDRIGFEGSTVVDRKDWGLTWNAALETGGFLVGDKVTLEVDISAVKVSG